MAVVHQAVAGQSLLEAGVLLVQEVLLDRVCLRTAVKETTKDVETGVSSLRVGETVRVQEQADSGSIDGCGPDDSCRDLLMDQASACDPVCTAEETSEDRVGSGGILRHDGEIDSSCAGTRRVQILTVARGLGQVLNDLGGLDKKILVGCIPLWSAEGVLQVGPGLVRVPAEDLHDRLHEGVTKERRGASKSTEAKAVVLLAVHRTGVRQGHREGGVVVRHLVRHGAHGNHRRELQDVEENLGEGSVERLDDTCSQGGVPGTIQRRQGSALEADTLLLGVTEGRQSSNNISTALDRGIQLLPEVELLTARGDGFVTSP